MGIGDWDKLVIWYGYMEFLKEINVKEAFNIILMEGVEVGLYYILDDGVWLDGIVYLLVYLWDNGIFVLQEFNCIMDLWWEALSCFGEVNILEGQFMFMLEWVLMLFYLLYWYQVVVCSKFLGGYYYIYVFWGDGQLVICFVLELEQSVVMIVLLRMVKLSELIILVEIFGLIFLQLMGYSWGREYFEFYIGIVFDFMVVVVFVIDYIFGLMLYLQWFVWMVNQEVQGDLQSIYFDCFVEVLWKMMDDVYILLECVILRVG